MGHVKRLGWWVAFGSVVLGAIPSGAAPNEGRISWSVGSDVTNAYFFRGILQERDGFIWQPWAEVAVSLYEGEGSLESLDATFGVWNSFHSEKTLSSGEGPSNLYETDYYPGLAASFAGGFEASILYVIYTGPNGSFSTIQQLDLGLAFDDGEWLGAAALHPAATFSFELDNTSFGDEEGGYFEFGISPGTELPLGDGAALELALPVAVGLSMYDYYETVIDDGLGNVTRDDETFGYVSAGVTATLPLAFVPEAYGSWSTTAGIVGIFLGDTLEEANEGDGIYPIGTWSLTLEY